MYLHIYSGVDILLQVEYKKKKKTTKKHSAASNITKHLNLIMCSKNKIIMEGELKSMAVFGLSLHQKLTSLF